MNQRWLWSLVCMFGWATGPVYAEDAEPPDTVAPEAYRKNDLEKSFAAAETLIKSNDPKRVWVGLRTISRIILDSWQFVDVQHYTDQARPFVPDAAAGAMLDLDIVEMNWRQAEYPEAEAALVKAIQTLKREKAQPELARAYLIAANLLVDRGNLKLAKSYADDALKIVVAPRGEVHVSASEVHAALGRIARAGGDLLIARRELVDAMDAIAGRFGRFHPRAIAVMIEAASVLIDLGDYIQAEHLLFEADQSMATRGLDSLMSARILDELARVYVLLEEPYVVRALNDEIFKMILAKNLPLRMPLVMNAYLRDVDQRDRPGTPKRAKWIENMTRAVVVLPASDFEFRITLAREASDAKEALAALDAAAKLAPRSASGAKLGEARVLEVRGIWHEAQKDYARAVDAYRSSALLYEVISPTHPQLANVVHTQGMAELKGGNAVRAMATMHRAADLRDRGLAKVRGASSTLRNAFLRKALHELDEVIENQLKLAASDADAAQLAMTLLLRRKGLALDIEAGSIGKVRKRGDTSDQQALTRARELHAAIAMWTLRGRADKASSLSTNMSALEASIAQRGALGVDPTPLEATGIAKRMGDGWMLIEIAAFRDHYAAYVLDHQGAVTGYDLGEQNAIDAAAETLRGLLRDPKSPIADVKKAANVTWRMLWKPLAGKVASATRVLVAADGALNLIPFAALFDNGGNWLVETTPLGYVASGREIAEFGARGTSKSDPIIIGAPEFGGRPTKPDPGDLLGDVEFTPLPGAAEEIASIAKLLPKAHRLTGDLAMETTIVQLAAPSILHVATHGFFLDENGETMEGARALVRVKAAAATTARKKPERIDPLVRSGLAFANANKRATDPNDDGILTASELGDVDLQGTKLVVLSACDTGIGEASVGDGVYGLRRALELAGAQTQVMTLWMVSDVATRDLMIEFYKRLVAGEGRTDALQRAQLVLLGRSATAHPYYWASFLASGDPSNLDGRVTLSPLHWPRGCCSANGGDPGLALVLALACALVLRRRQSSP